MATWDGSYPGDAQDDGKSYQYSNSQNRVTDDPSDRSWNQDNNQSAPAANYVDNNQPSVTYPSSSSGELSNQTFAASSNIYFINNLKFHQSSSTDSNFLLTKSNLHPGASEFIPSGVNNQPSESSKVFFSDNRSKNYGRKYDKKNNTNYRQDGDYYQRNSFKAYDKSRKNNFTNSNTNNSNNNPSYNYSNDYQPYKDYSDVSFDNKLSNSKDKYNNNNRRPRSNGRYNNDRYSSANRQSNLNSNDYQSTSNNLENRPRNLNQSSYNYNDNSKDSGDISQSDRQSDRHPKGKQPLSRDPRDERYRGFTGDSSDDRQMLKKDNRRGKNNKDFYDDPRDERYRHSSRRKGDYSNYYEEKVYRDKNHRDNKSESKQFKEETVGKFVSKEEFVQEDKLNNWRSKNSPIKKNSGSKKRVEVDDAATQKECLTEQLNRGHLECLVCCENIRQNDAVWSCSNCYHVLHLKCLKKWAESSQSESGWRCPACQNINLVIPEDYYCFCGKTRSPEWNRQDVAHSCGEVCGRTRAKNNCVHKCTLLCHPGSCPLCLVMVNRSCGCGKTSQSCKCSTDTQLSCSATCDKLLNCGKHKCEKTCHHGNCEPCDKKIEQNCHCGKKNQFVECLKDTEPFYSCGEACNNLLDCGNHNCRDICHPGPCGSCSLNTELVTHCCCGQTPLAITRASCLDPIPTCDKICSKKLKCGQPSSPHSCKASCHVGDCPPCDLTTWVKCRCGNMDREIPCCDLTTKADDARCEKKCVKKRSCGKHKCNQLCCIDIEHICPLPCSKTLSCGKHKCELTCHKSRCHPCYISSFDELYCECGAAVIYPPVPCGTRKPTCSQPCSRQHSCGHQVLHNCHSEASCPPCTVLTQKWCYGKHELRKAVPCYYNEISCGMPCNKPVRCGRHKCITLCHPGACEKPKQVCVQPCTVPREICGHNCAAPCHDGKCPDTPCKEMVKVTCTCGNRSMTRACAENSREYQRIASGILASKMIDMQLGHSVDLEEVFGQGARKQNQLRTLECNEECRTIERNRKLALGLQIVNPDLSGKLMPRYSDYMKQCAKKDPPLCKMIHDKLTELVQLAKTSKQKSRSYSFDSMNRCKRQFVHEYCEHFGCESQAYDEEPKRNVVATAVKDKCWLPSYSLLEIVQRENGQRKVPRPLLNSVKTATPGISEVLPSTASKSQKSQTSSTWSAPKSTEIEIDYFDYPNPKWK
ncbi:protein shuttle craft [Cotesia glomerata]|uniref:Protein shuttle craft n=1 Tax=Cotesia glomerata TaxID=32391 RepID=A0AAV7IDS6_COTGL|nr:protein shuttle craft [Cotesia glomerata]KAH0550470.1 hypothetical protein KQX54_019600 [Cotesia glomerata]